MFYALAKDLIPARGFRFLHILQDIQTLNERATRGELDITAVSIHAYAHVSDKYALLPSGASMGDGYGPMLVAKRKFSREEIAQKKIAVPGTMTSAFLALQLWLGEGSPNSVSNSQFAIRNSQFFLDLGDVRQSARVKLNGKDYGTLITPPFRVVVDNLKPTGNTLEVEVTSVAANRIRDLDRRSVPWKTFRDINIVDLNYKPFDASHWPLTDCGLLGPVTLYPVTASP